jgi:hypothetical protein
MGFRHFPAITWHRMSATGVDVSVNVGSTAPPRDAQLDHKNRQPCVR